MKRTTKKLVSLLIALAMVLPGASFAKATAVKAEETKAEVTKESAPSFEYGRGRKDIVGYSEEDINKWINKTIEVESINGKEKYKGTPVDEIDTEKELQKLAEPGDIVDMKQVDKQSKSEKLGLSMSAYAAGSKTVTVTPHESVHYAGWVTNHFEVNDGSDSFEGFCAQPNKPTPRGTFTAHELNNITIKYIIDQYRKNPQAFNFGDNQYYGACHAVIAYIYSGDTTGLAPSNVAVLVPFANALRADAEAAIAQNPNWLSNLTLWVAPNAAQDIIWVEEQKNGYVKLNKSSLNTDITNGNSCYSLAGAEFTVYSNSAATTAVGKLTTNANGETNTLELEQGTYYYKETKAPKGYGLDNSVKSFKITAENTTTLSVKDAPQADPIPILLQKLDKEHKSKDGGTYSTAGGTLQGAQFQMHYQEGNRTWVWETDEDGFAIPDTMAPISGDPTYKSGDGHNVFPVGHYTITEIKAPEGYVLDSTPINIQVVAENNVVDTTSGDTITVIHTFNEDVAAVAPEDQIKRGDIQFDKKSDDQEPIANCPFVVVEKTTGEAHIIVTDPNGIYDSSAYAHSTNTNGNDAAVTWKSDGSKVVDDPDRENDEMEVDEGALDYKAGTWFGNDQNNKISDPVNANGAFPYSDNYQVREIRSSANEGYSLIGFGVVNVSVNSANSGTIHLGTKTDRQIDIRTTAHDKDTKTQVSYADTETTIVDKVEYTGLKKNETYVMKGSLHLKEIAEDGTVSDGGVVTDAEGKEVTAEKEFTATGTNGYVNLEFKFNSTNIADQETVVFEKLFDAEGTTELANHEDAEDNDQTITVEEPEIGTTAKDGKTESHDGILAKETTIVDTIKYEGLKEGKEYTAKGTLHIQSKDDDGNITDGGELLDSDGNPVTAEKTFTAGKKGKGKVEITFKFDSSLLFGETVVAFEEISRDGFTVGTHADIEDEEQSVEYPVPKIGTTLTDKANEGHETAPDPEVVLVDTIKYENLPIGVELTFTGVLMDKETGEPFKVDDKEVTATTTTTLEEGDGTIDIEFKFSTVDLAGKTLVAFEEVTTKVEAKDEGGDEGGEEGGEDEGSTEEDVTVAEHKDIDDVDQTVTVKPIEVKTTAAASDGNSAINPKKNEKIVDKVKCSGLIIGKEYTVTGKVYDKETGKAIDAKGSTTFTAKKTEEEVTVVFTFDARNLAGKSLVVGEDLYRQDKKVASHFDLEDRAQMVTVNKTNQSGSPIKTGDTRMLLVLIGLMSIAGLSILSFKKKSVVS